MGVNHSTQGHRDGQRHQQPGAHHRQHRPVGRRAVLDHGPVQRDGHARSRASRRRCRATASSSARRIAKNWSPRSGTCRSIGFRRRAASRIPTSSKRRSSKRVRALWVIATNPIVSFPNLGVLRQALETLDFLVVQDGFHPTPTSELAHLVLPAAIWGEKDGHVHEFRTPRQQGEPRGGSAGRSAQRLRHLSRISRARSDAPTSCFRAGPSRRTRSKNGSACPRAACATTRA